MPQPFKNAVITNAGASLLTQAQAGEITIEFTRMVTGNGTYTTQEKTLAALQAMTALKAQKNSYTLSNIDIFTERSVKITALITNQDPVTGQTLVSEGYYINEVGLYAKPHGESESGEEVLYSIAVTAGESGDFMPPYNNYNPAQIIQEFIITVDNAANVTINTFGAALLVEDANRTYMPKSGGEFTGNIHFVSEEPEISTNSHYIQAYNNGSNFMWIVSRHPWVGLRIVSWEDLKGKYGAVSDTYDNVSDLGLSDKRWKQLYAANSTISTSDRSEKREISYIGKDRGYDTEMSDSQLIELIMGIKPAVFKRTNGESGRPHHGMISQDIEELILSLGIDHAGFIKSPVKKQVEVYEVDGKEVMRRDLEGVPDEEMQEEIQKEYGEDVKKRIVEETVEGEFKYGLRYEEFIGDIIRFCQILKNENGQLKEEIQAIKSDMQLLKTKDVDSM